MSDLSPAERAWRERNAGVPAVERVQAFVGAAMRARRRQVLLEHLWGGLFFGLLGASGALVASRAQFLPYDAPATMAAIVGVALLIAAMLAWRRFPNALDVAIAADLKLNLRQRLSSAFEFVSADKDSPLAKTLAHQAVRARLPARPELTFPLRLNAFGRVVPLAVLLLAIASMLEFDTVSDPRSPAADSLVVHEGVRLRDYARRMQQRARADGLPRSAAAASKLERLGSRMESGTLDRDRVLERLEGLSRAIDEERRRALMEAQQTQIGPLQSKALDATPQMRPQLQRLLSGRQLSAEEIARLADEAGQRLQRSASDEELMRAWRELDDGDAEAMQRLLERLDRAERARGDASTLDRARSQIERSRENLGDRSVPSEQRTQSHGDGHALMDEESAFADGDDLGEDGLSDREDGRSPGSRAGSESDRPRRPAPVPPGEPDARVVLRPQSRFHEGKVFSSTARVLPREGDIRAEREALAVDIQNQLESVLARDDYPLHYKEFVRRYFLTLTQGKRREESDR